MPIPVLLLTRRENLGREVTREDFTIEELMGLKTNLEYCIEEVDRSGGGIDGEEMSEILRNHWRRLFDDAAPPITPPDERYDLPRAARAFESGSPIPQDILERDPDIGHQLSLARVWRRWAEVWAKRGRRGTPRFAEVVTGPDLKPSAMSSALSRYRLGDFAIHHKMFNGFPIRQDLLDMVKENDEATE